MHRLVLTLLGLLLVAGCSQSHAPPQYVANWEQVKVGMSRLKVRYLLGEPYREAYRRNASVPAPLSGGASASEREQIIRELGGGETGWSERWQYGRFGLRDAAGLVGGSDKAFIVDFNADGQVIALRRPLAGPLAAGTQPSDGAKR